MAAARILCEGRHVEPDLIGAMPTALGGGVGSGHPKGHHAERSPHYSDTSHSHTFRVNTPTQHKAMHLHFGDRTTVRWALRDQSWLRMCTQFQVTIQGSWCRMQAKKFLSPVLALATFTVLLLPAWDTWG